MTAVAEDKDAYRASFERFASAHAASDPAWLRERRTAAIARFVEKGLPTPRDEAWRHTPVAPLTRGRFEPADPAATPPPAVLEALPREGFHGAHLVFVNGRLSPGLSSLEAGEPGVEVASLRDLLRSSPGRLEPWLGRAADGRTGVFADLNTAFAEDGAVVIVAPGAVLKEPVRIAHVSAGDEAPTVAYARTLVVAGRGSECRVVETFASPDGRASLANAVTEVVVEDNAFVDRYKLQLEGAESLHVATLVARLARDARFSDHSIVLRGRPLAQRHRGALRGRGRGVRARTASSWWTAAGWPTPTRRSTTRSRTAPAASSTRASSTARPAASSTGWWWFAPARRRPTPGR